ncbi:MAG: DUF983 domain-containing protein [Candidatus Binatia bacterium]
MRGLRLRCPRCGAPGVFESFWNLRRFCLTCHLRLEREQGYFVGAIYLNYAATIAIVVPGYFILDHLTQASLKTQLVLWSAIAALFPVVFLRYSKGLWLALGYLLDPLE